ncbi:MAG: flagellar type III secretion system protein FlhB [Pseudomonadota bacterium]
MADDSDEEQDDKNYEPTPQKLDKAREQGNIAQSKELHGLALYIGILSASLFAGAWSVTYIGERLYLLMANAHMMIVGENRVSLAEALGDLTLHVLIGLIPIVGTMMLFPLISMVAQQSITFAPDKIIPKISRISLIQGFKNKFGRDALVEFLKGLVKVGLVGVGFVIIAMPMIDGAPALIGMNYRLLGPLLANVWIEVLIAVTSIAAVIGIFDFLWQKYSFMQRMMMSYKEIKDEMKENQGDPHLKSKRQEMGRDIAMNQMLADVKEANVIIVNPTHYAVALKWSHGQGHAPICIAKGTDEIAFEIRARAKEHNIPLRSDPPLARTLYASVKVGDEILEEHYRAVAAAIRFADEQRRKRKGRIYS